MFKAVMQLYSYTRIKNTMLAFLSSCILESSSEKELRMLTVLNVPQSNHCPSLIEKSVMKHN